MTIAGGGGVYSGDVGMDGLEEEKEDAINLGDIVDATVVLDALEDIAHSKKMEVPGVGLLYKQTICARYYNSGLEKIASDIGMRYANLDKPVFDVRESEWNIGPSFDVAVKFDGDFHLGRIVRVRRRYANGCDVWIRPFDLLKAKAAKIDLHFLYTWYKRGEDAALYTFAGVHDPNEWGLATIICPVSLIYDIEDGVYRVPPGQQEVIDQAMSGATELT